MSSELSIVGLAEKLNANLVKQDAILSGRIAPSTFAFSTETAEADPGDGYFRLNSAVMANVTEIYFDDKNVNGTNVDAILRTYDSGSGLVKGRVKIVQRDNSSIHAGFAVLGNVVDENGYTKLTVEHLYSNGTFTADAEYTTDFSEAGPPGAAAAMSVASVQTVEFNQPAYAEFEGVAPNQRLILKIPRGVPGDTGPAPSISAGTIEDGDFEFTVTGEAPNYLLNFKIPKGTKGDQGDQGFGILVRGVDPTPEDARDNDVWLNWSDSSIVYKSLGVWSAKKSLRGDKGDAGNDGADGTKMAFFPGVPTINDGNPGDILVDDTSPTFDIYEVQADGVALKGSMKGDPGDGSGDVVGPNNAVPDHIAVFDGATGKFVKSAGLSAQDIINQSSRTPVVALNGDVTVADDTILIHGGQAAHTVTISSFRDGGLLTLTDPDNGLGDFPVSLQCRVVGTERLLNGDFTGSTVTIDHDPNGSHDVPNGYDVEDAENVDAAGWSVVEGVVQFSATATGGGINQANAFVLDKLHKVTGRVRKVSGDSAATLAVFCEGDAGGDLTEVYGDSDNNWVDFEVDCIPTGGSDRIAVVNQSGAAVWEIERLSVMRYAEFFLSDELSDDTLIMDVAGRTTVFAFQAEKERFVRI